METTTTANADTLTLLEKFVYIASDFSFLQKVIENVTTEKCVT